MPFQSVPDTVEARFVYSSTGGPVMMNTLFFKNVGTAVTTARLTELGETLAGVWNSSDGVMLSLADDFTLDRIELRDISVQFGAMLTFETNIQGAWTSDVGNYGSSILARFHGDAGAAPRQGRIFLPPSDESTLNNNLWTSQITNQLKGDLEGLPLAIIDIDWLHVIVSRFLNGEPRANGVTNQVASYSIRSLVASQRDRRPGA